MEFLREGTTYYTPLLELEPGINKVEIFAKNCTKVGEIAKNKDIRCVSIGIKRIEVIPYEKAREEKWLYLFANGWYEKAPNEDVRWMRKRGEIYLFNWENSTKKVLVKIEGRSFFQKRRISILFNQKMLRSITWPSKTFKINLTLSLNPGMNELLLITNSCDIPKYKEGYEDYRCLSLGIITSDFQLRSLAY